MKILAELPLIPGVSASGDRGVPAILKGNGENNGEKEWKDSLTSVADAIMNNVE